MTRLQIVQKYMSAYTKVKDIEKFEQAQRLSKKIIDKFDEKLRKMNKQLKEKKNIDFNEKSIIDT